MDMTDTIDLLAFFTVGWKQFQSQEATAEVWQEALSDIDATTAAIAAKRLLTVLEFPPSVARFREECQLVNRNRYQRLTSGPVEDAVSRERSAAFAAALSRGLKAASDLIPKHDHHVKPGKKRADWRDCPACSTADARRPAVEAAIRAEFNVERDAS